MRWKKVSHFVSGLRAAQGSVLATRLLELLQGDHGGQTAHLKLMLQFFIE
jgi:hypothetical protein